MKVANKLYQNYVQLIREVLHKKSSTSVTTRKSINERKLKTKKSTHNVSDLNSHVKSKKKLFKAKEKLKRRKMECINMKPTCFINNFTNNDVKNIIKFPKEIEEEKELAVGPIQSVKIKIDKPKIYKQKSGNDKLETHAKKRFVYHEKKLESNQCELLENTLTSKQAEIKNGINSKKQKLKWSVSYKSLKRNKTSLINGNKDKPENKVSKYVRKRKLTEESSTKNIKRKKAEVNILCGNIDNEDVGLNEQVIPQETELKIPDKHFNITVSDLESDNENEIEGLVSDKLEDVKVVGNLNSVQNNDVEKVEMDVSNDKLYCSDGANRKTREFKNSNIVRLEDNNIMMFLEPGCSMHFHGLCYLKILFGEIETFGAIFNHNDDVINLMSPRGTSLLYIRNNINFSTPVEFSLAHLNINLMLLPEEHRNRFFNQNTAVLLFMGVNSTTIDFLELYIPQKIFPTNYYGKGPRLDLELKGVWNKLEIDHCWNDALNDISENSVVAITGGKGTGKSTFLRYAVNKMLDTFSQIIVVDLDSGQPEFVPPGFISVVKVKNMLLGPNYSHQMHADYMIMSHINIGYDVQKYLWSAKYLSELLSNQSYTEPILINFPGFTSGFGLDIAVNIINLFQPTKVIEILSQHRSKNYNLNLTANNVNKCGKESTATMVKPLKHLDYEYVILTSLAENHTAAWSLEARQSRELSIVAYFSQMSSHKLLPLCSPNLTMYSINLSSVSIRNTDGQTISPLAINANLVALGTILDVDYSIYLAYGYGIVRGIDIENDVLILITPTKKRLMQKVDCLILGSVTIPPSFLMNSNSTKTLIPYIGIGEPTEFGQFTKRSYLPPGK